MLTVKPAYYDKFRCIGGDCDFTCCQEWKIAVDDETNKEWKQIKPPAGAKSRRKNLSLFTKFKDGQRVIDLDRDHKCPFLDENKLCRLVIAYGEEMISDTCHIFPREIHDFEDRKEYTLMPCCPVVVDFLNQEEFKLVTEENLLSEEKRMPEEQPETELSQLRALRTTFMEIQKQEEMGLEEGILVNFYLALDEMEASEQGDGGVYSYCMSRSQEEMLDFAGEVKTTIRGLDFDQEGRFLECNELFLDLVDNYRKEGMYEKYLEEVWALADTFSEGEGEAETYVDFLPVWEMYQPLMNNLLIQEYYADLLIPGGDLEGAVVKLQWIAMEMVAIRHLCFLSWKLKGGLDYETVRDYIVMVSRMMGYEEDDIYEYMENSFQELIWDWGYMALIVGR